MHETPATPTARTDLTPFVESGLTAILAIGGVHLGGDVGAALPAMAPAAASVLMRRHRRALAVTEGLDVDSLLAAVADSPRRGELLREAVDAAMDSVSEHKIRALRVVLAEGLAAGDDTAVDVSRQIVDTLRQLEVLHIRVLAEVANPPRVEEGQHMGLDRDMLLTRQPSLGPVLDKILADCERLGLIYDTSQGTMGSRDWAGRTLRLTGYGRACLDQLHAMRDE